MLIFRIAIRLWNPRPAGSGFAFFRLVNELYPSLPCIAEIGHFVGAVIAIRRAVGIANVVAGNRFVFAWTLPLPPVSFLVARGSIVVIPMHAVLTIFTTIV